ncbi:MAG: HIT domain-containing protein [Halobacteriales archaeon]|nr:HIT domain-containing protein [Halobacteriales archaeon]
MDQLFAPWRIEWVERERPEDEEECVLCALPERDDAREARVVAATERAYVVLNNYPYNPGHAMVVPRPHGGEYGALDDETLLEHARLKQRTFEALRDAMGPDGFNTGLNLGAGAGGSIDDHLHTHVVPRWRGDTNFMAVLNETKVIVEALDRTYGRLRDAFAGQAGATVGEPTDPIRLALD